MVGKMNDFIDASKRERTKSKWKYKKYKRVLLQKIKKKCGTTALLKSGYWNTSMRWMRINLKTYL